MPPAGGRGRDLGPPPQLSGAGEGAQLHSNLVSPAPDAPAGGRLRSPRPGAARLHADGTPRSGGAPTSPELRLHRAQQYVSALQVLRKAGSTPKRLRSPEQRPAADPEGEATGCTPRHRTERSAAPEPCAYDDGFGVDPEGHAIYQDDRATFVDATYEDSGWVARRLSASPSAQTVLSPLHPNTQACTLRPPGFDTPGRFCGTQSEGRNAGSCGPRSIGRAASQPTVSTHHIGVAPPPLPMTDSEGRAPSASPSPKLGGAAYPAAAAEGGTRAPPPPSPPPLPPAAVGRSGSGCRLSPPRPSRPPASVQLRGLSPPSGGLAGGPVSRHLLAPELAPRASFRAESQDRSGQLPVAIPSPATPPAARAAADGPGTPYAEDRYASFPVSAPPSLMECKDDAEMAELRSKALTAAAAQVPPALAAAVLRMDRENRVFRAVCKDRGTVVSDLEQQLTDERRKSQDYIQKAVALSARLEESKRHIRRLKKLVAEVRQTNLPVHNELLQARLGEMERKKDEQQRRQEEDARTDLLLREQQADYDEQMAQLEDELGDAKQQRAALDRLVDALSAQHTDDLRRAIEAASELAGPAAEAAALRVQRDGYLQLLRDCYVANEQLRGDDRAAARRAGHASSARQVQEARDLARQAVDDRWRLLEAHRVDRRQWDLERDHLQRSLQWAEHELAKWEEQQQQQQQPHARGRHSPSDSSSRGAELQERLDASEEELRRLASAVGDPGRRDEGGGARPAPVRPADDDSARFVAPPRRPPPSVSAAAAEPGGRRDPDPEDM
eukprot:TRINITY_DN7834_c0_g2_i1.p1 TRINITY_DN7834_c0_g2~~TRINITY_DN7834_c0_g2_i1.p1  ORF type:complete len:809 (+),score=260.28 TRINITY_DN7834_c0_g2_i1:76-2427(+)